MNGTVQVGILVVRELKPIFMFVGKQEEYYL